MIIFCSVSFYLGYEYHVQVIYFRTVTHCRYEGYDMSIATNDQEEVTFDGNFHHLI